ncbi:hypothetical protein MMB17_04790 [Methylobacterium organophilum]|uniref:hypothetical protein n=1 Tax=Methylobacterium organophilum TaxID=410 RepID=UPI001F14656C|nr:hypothetical protein [Methylobacterium organophilum]UMY18649.1 hypothetical protein MMB17_04790 [Methylobacterium organophilum]
MPPPPAARLAIAAGRIVDFEVVPEIPATGRRPARRGARPRPQPGDGRGGRPRSREIRRIWEGRAETLATPGQFGAEGVLTLDRLRRNLPMRCALPASAVPLVTAPPAAPSAAPAPAPPPMEADAAETVPDDAASEAALVARWDETLSGPPSPPCCGGWRQLVDRTRRLHRTLTTPSQPRRPAPSRRMPAPR